MTYLRPGQDPNYLPLNGDIPVIIFRSSVTYLTTFFGKLNIPKSSI